jgi:TonB family protein
MESFRIYGKTELGAAALNAARGALSSSARRLLILVDGQRSVGELEGIFGAEALARLLPQLEVQGLVQFLHDSAGTPASIVGARPLAAPAMPADAPQGPPRNRLAISLLALSVMAASAAIWWFFGQPPSGAGAADAATIPAAAPSTADSAAAGATDASVIVEAPATATALPPSAASAREQNLQRGRDPNRVEAGAETHAEKRAEKRPDARAVSATALGSRAAAPAPPASASSAALSRTTASPAPAVPSAPTPSATPAGNGASLAAGTPLGPAAPIAAPANAAAAAPAPSPEPAMAANAAAAPASAAGSAGQGARPRLHPRERTLPELSRSARRAGIDSGELVVRLHVSPRGTVESIDLVKADPSQVYDLSVEQILKTWTFDPPGVPVESTVKFRFKP